ncbi:MAG TPA: SPOR domain-containing protein [Allosphingosinicella sp.]
MRRYRPSRSWPVGALALAAATGAVLTTGALSSALDDAPQPAFATRIAREAASLPPATRPPAAAPAAAAPASAAPAALNSAPLATRVWQVQVGAFRSTAAAEAHLRTLESGVPELARLTPVHQLRGGLNRVRIGGIEDEGAAHRLCARIAASGRGCFVVGPES